MELAKVITDDDDDDDDNRNGINDGNGDDGLNG